LSLSFLFGTLSGEPITWEIIASYGAPKIFALRIDALMTVGRKLFV